MTLSVFRPMTGLLLLAISIGCQVNPETGRNQLVVLSTSRAIELGEKAVPDFLKDNGGEVPSSAVQQYVSSLGHKLAQQSKGPKLPWQFHVLDSAQLNAFALPGGKVCISRGLLSKLDNEAQLAGVLGHEIGHVRAKHINDQMARRQVIGMAAIAVGVASQSSDEKWLRTLGVGVSVGGTLYLLKFSREAEHEADQLGVRYMAACGYNPMAQVQVMQLLQEESSKSGRQLQLLSTHPLPKQRVKQLRAFIKDQFPNYATNEQFGYHREPFHQAVISSLEKLPPPKHAPKGKGKP